MNKYTSIAYSLRSVEALEAKYNKKILQINIHTHIIDTYLSIDSLGGHDLPKVYTYCRMTVGLRWTFLCLLSWTKIIWTTAKNGIVPDTTSNAQPI